VNGVRDKFFSSACFTINHTVESVAGLSLRSADAPERRAVTDDFFEVVLSANFFFKIELSSSSLFLRFQFAIRERVSTAIATCFATWPNSFSASGKRRFHANS